MPTIEITDEQAVALARGENISITPKPPAGVKHYVAVGRHGNTYSFTTRNGEPQPWTILRSPHTIYTRNAPYTSSRAYDFHRNGDEYTVVEVER